MTNYPKFYRYSTDVGVKFIKSPDNLIADTPLGAIYVHNLINDAEDRKVAEDQVSDYYWNRRMLSAFKMENSIVNINNSSYRNSNFLTGTKVVLNGASGDRARNKYRKKHNYSDDSSNYILEYFSERCDVSSLPIEEKISTKVALECKNYFNFFHFASETLHHTIPFLEMSCEETSAVNIFSSTDVPRDFIDSWCKFISTDFMKKISINHTKSFGATSEVSTSLSAKHLLYQLSGDHHVKINAASPAGWKWTEYSGRPHEVGVLAMNSYDASLEALRNYSIGIAKLSEKKEWPKKVYVARSDKARLRPMLGEKKLIEKLKELDFEVVYFEKMTPLEQVSCVNNAKVVVSQHGAGLTNMMFASDQTHVFEIGTLQTILSRWSDFIPLASVSKCHYHKVLVDMDFPASQGHPVFERDGIVPPSLLHVQVESIADLIERCLGDKTSGDIAGFVLHSEYLRSRKAWNKMKRLVDGSEKFFYKNFQFWAQKARLEERVGSHADAISSFTEAWKLSGKERFRNEAAYLSSKQAASK